MDKLNIFVVTMLGISIVLTFFPIGDVPYYNFFVLLLTILYVFVVRDWLAARRRKVLDEAKRKYG